MTYSQICYDVIRAVATITLNRPERLNAWTPTMAAEFRQAMEQVQQASYRMSEQAYGQPSPNGSNGASGGQHGAHGVGGHEDVVEGEFRTV